MLLQCISPTVPVARIWRNTWQLRQRFLHHPATSYQRVACAAHRSAVGAANHLTCARLHGFSGTRVYGSNAICFGQHLWNVGQHAAVTTRCSFAPEPALPRFARGRRFRGTIDSVRDIVYGFAVSVLILRLRLMIPEGVLRPQP
jgi:hypothetical protein